MAVQCPLGCVLRVFDHQNSLFGGPFLGCGALQCCDHLGENASQVLIGMSGTSSARSPTRSEAKRTFNQGPCLWLTRSQGPLGACQVPSLHASVEFPSAIPEDKLKFEKIKQWFEYHKSKPKRDRDISMSLALKSKSVIERHP